MKHEPDIPRTGPSRVAHGDAFQPLVERAYRVLDRPAPRHVPGCGCALCADRAHARMMAERGARDWSVEDVLLWARRATGSEAGRAGVQVASRTDRAVFRFLLPRVLEMLATGTLPFDATAMRLLMHFSPGDMSGRSDAERGLLHRFAGLTLDHALHDATAPLDVIETLRLLACGGWPLNPLIRQAMSDPDLPAALARCWARAERSEPPIAGQWPAGAAATLRTAFVSHLMVERMMNFAMAEGTSSDETEAGTRAADLLLRNL